MKEIKRSDIFEAIIKERERQDVLHPLCKLKKSDDKEVKIMATLINNNEMLAVLVEEIGEIARALQGEGNLEEEMIQAAAVIVRWLEIKDPSD